MNIEFNSVMFEVVTVVLMTIPFFLDVTLGEWFLISWKIVMHSSWNLSDYSGNWLYNEAESRPSRVKW